jgi:hypothetical protein
VTVQDLITQSYRKGMLVPSGGTPSPEELADGLVSLNQMIGGWNEILEKVLAGSYASILYTFTPIPTFATLGETVNLPQGWIRALVYNLTVDIVPEHEREPSATVLREAAASKAAVMTLPAPAA